MAAITYDEDVEFGVDLDEDDIRRCSDIETLVGWSDDCDATIEDIKAQITASAAGGYAERGWVYRAGKAMGFMARAKSRIRSRLLVLGWVPAARTQELTELTRKLAEAKAREAVAVEFLRLCTEGALERAQFSRIEARAIALVKDREAETARKAAKAAVYQTSKAA